MKVEALQRECARLVRDLLAGRRVEWPVNLDASTLARQLIEHGMHALVDDAIRRSEVSVPSELAERLKDATRAEVVSKALLEEEIPPLLAAFEEKGIRTLLIKGVPLSWTHYALPHLRPVSDVDLLVDRSDAPAAENLLAELAFEPELTIRGDLVRHQVTYAGSHARGSGMRIDLHWSVSNVPLLGRLLRFSELHARRRRVPPLGPSASALDDLDALLLAIIHRVGHHRDADRLIWLYDIHLLVESIPTERDAEMIALAREKKITAIWAAAVSEASARLGTRSIGGMEAGGSDELSARYLDREMPRWEELRLDLRALRGTEKLRLLFEHAFPGRDYMRARYRGSQALPLLYLKRFLGVLKE
ncbi:MAG TPA: nucleotidyltransferase family protein [Thermoanaerobaculia bacterium]|nr:nucleotidyltransferase family protein [Thermoanaerobaculia bacterium]